MARKNELSIGEAIEAFLEERGLKNQAAAERVITYWPQVVGHAIAENTESLWFREGVFYVRMRHPMWKNELSMAKSKLRELLNRAAGSEVVQEVRIL